MTFLEEHENYRTYQSDRYFVNNLPSDIQEALEGFLILLSDDKPEKLKFIINKIATIVNSGITQNWGWEYLLHDLSAGINKIIKSDLDKFFDFLYLLYNEGVVSSADINKFLEDNAIGYKLDNGDFGPVYWELRDENSVSSVIERSENLIQTTANKCQQTKEHLKQLINNVDKGSDRALKDALRDALSAMEALMEDLTNTENIDDADKVLRHSGIADKSFLQDGIKIWNWTHREHKDIRHGCPNIENFKKEELFYCLNKILIYIEFLYDLDI